jgi:hypothetical protein
VCRYPVLLATFVEEVVFSPSYVLGAFAKSQVGIAAHNYIWVLYSVPLVFMSVFLQYHGHAVFIAMAL